MACYSTTNRHLQGVPNNNQLANMKQLLKMYVLLEIWACLPQRLFCNTLWALNWSENHRYKNSRLSIVLLEKSNKQREHDFVLFATDRRITSLNFWNFVVEENQSLKLRFSSSKSSFWGFKWTLETRKSLILSSSSWKAWILNTNKTSVGHQPQFRMVVIVD